MFLSQDVAVASVILVPGERVSATENNLLKTFHLSDPGVHHTNGPAVDCALSSGAALRTPANGNGGVPALLGGVDDGKTIDG